MIDAYIAFGGQVRRQTAIRPDELPPEAIWIDLRNPTREEEKAVERLCGLEVPTREEMREIEVSSRLYSEDGGDFMTTSIVYGLDEGRPDFGPVTFILVENRLITLRYTEPRSFAIYANKLCRGEANGDGERALQLPGFDLYGPPAAPPKPSRAKGPTADSIAVGLLETVIDRVADLLEAIAADLDRIGTDIFRSSADNTPTPTSDFKQLLRRIGAAGDLSSRTRESLATIDRLLPFLQFVLDRRKPQKELKLRVKAMARDIHSLNDFVSFLSNKTTFLLDTTVGMISIEQNAIIKIFSVAAVGFMPPTLVASIYGMNFVHMPELNWPLGYPMALGLMVLSAVLPLMFFRHKKWL
ncbi:magnesium transporter CorA family protein [Aureimonas jatrophae]|jgi:magnesium transporter|uniref:Magnesium transport protein CorA n=1 Tax=Aureimonas jatrophae TaxID=1166073 RepID=A0A1H0J8Y5_9HYPH|nr:magnesium transporter CorA family protein [Aureimonas jatrophae]MBB3951542.1 magnesium transporter [Aureimonas jatrophae]SDO39939.1 magnesium transporter [Aureimonas jatrophae]